MCQKKFSITLITASLIRYYQNCFVKLRKIKLFARFIIIFLFNKICFEFIKCIYMRAAFNQ